MMRLSYTVVAIHELPLHIDTKAFSAIDIFKKLKCYLFPYFDEDKLGLRRLFKYVQE